MIYHQRRHKQTPFQSSRPRRCGRTSGAPTTSSSTEPTPVSKVLAVRALVRKRRKATTTKRKEQRRQWKIKPTLPCFGTRKCLSPYDRSFCLVIQATAATSSHSRARTKTRMRSARQKNTSVSCALSHLETSASSTSHRWVMSADPGTKRGLMHIKTSNLHQPHHETSFVHRPFSTWRFSGGTFLQGRGRQRWSKNHQAGCCS